MILDIFLIFLCAVLLISCVFWAYLLIFVLLYKVPLISTHKSVVKKMVELVDLHPKSEVYELGCGFAPMLFSAAKKEPAAHFYGVEVLRPILWYNRLKTRFLKLEIEFINADFFKLDYRKTDVIFCYLWDTIMQQIYEDVWPDLKSGAVIITHDFPIKPLKSEQVIKVGKSKIYVYRKN